MSFLYSSASLLGGQDSPPVYTEANDPGLSDTQDGYSTACDPNDACCHWYSYLTLGCIGQQIGTGVQKATAPITTEVNTLVIIVVVAIIVIVALILFGKNTAALASHLRIG
jgi:hypothetical protein